MQTDTTSARNSRIEMRLSPVAKSIIEQAAAVHHKSVTDFMLENSLSAAFDTLADQRFFALTDEQWAEFNARLDAPPAANQGLKDLASRGPSWKL
jgi:uncharacterized protein (DUF1778 family)